MSMFRASPWVPYDPTPSSHQNRQRQQPQPEPTMDVDNDYDAPPISSIRDEATPPPKKTTLTIRKKASNKPVIRVEHTTPVKKPDAATHDAEDQEEEEDQLIDDDDEDALKPSPSVASRSGENTPKKKIPAKRKPRKSDKEGPEKRLKEKASQPTDLDVTNPDVVDAAESINAAIKKKKPATKKVIPTASRVPKLKLPAKQKSAIPPSVLEDTGVLSESYAGTAASSPVTAQLEQISPEPENIPPSSPPAPSAALPEEPNLENIPIPVYPLPTKPFPVQPPPKIPTGLAAAIPLDKSGVKPRHWREAKREIRGIGGGRWFARTWVGDKDSQFANHVISEAQNKSASDEKPSISVPKLPSLSANAAKVSSKLKTSSKVASASTSATPSRDPSAIPEPQASSSIVRAPTKMRIQVGPPSEAGDSDMGPPTEV